MLNRDYKEILQNLLDNEVRFLVVGAYAMGAYGYPRATGDLDIWVEATAENSRRVYQSLSEFGAPLSGITQKTFSEEGIVFQIGVAPRRIDILTHIDGVRFKAAHTARQEIKFADIKVPFISKEDLIRNKEATGREKDRLDTKYLKKRKS